jgi:nitroreductase
VKVLGRIELKGVITMKILEMVRTRRSIRHYESKPVEEDKINTVLEAARWAPSWSNTQCWRFIVVKDEAVKSRLAETLTQWNPARSASSVTQAPVVIVACAELGKSGFKDGVLSTDRDDWYVFDVALAVQNLVLVAHSLGLGTLHIGAFDAGEAARILKVPPGVVVIEMIPLGYAERVGKTPPRKELSEIVFHESYGQK